MGRLARPHGDRFGRGEVLKSWQDTAGFASNCTGIGDLDRSNSHQDIPSVDSANFPLDKRLYTFEVEIDLLLLNPAYPREPKTVGEHIRKARMDRGLMIKELASILGVAPNTVSRWELGKTKPTGSSLEGLKEVLGASSTSI